MASPPTTLARRSTLALFPTIIKLAWWRLTQMWRALLVTWLGMIALVVLICSVPLFTQVSSTVGLRNALSNVPPAQQRVTVSFASNHPTANQILQAHQQITQLVQQNLGNYTSGTSHFAVTLPPLTLQTSATHSNSSPALLNLTGYELDQVGSELSVVQGRLPGATSSQSEIVLTQPMASGLKARVGSVLNVTFPSYAGSVSWQLHVVGIVAPQASWEYATNPQPVNTSGGTLYQAIASSTTLLPQIASMQIALTDRQQFGDKQLFVAGVRPFFNLVWSYPFDVARVDANQLDTLVQSTNTLSDQLDNTLVRIQDASLFQRSPQGAVFSVLSSYSLETKIAAIPITALLALILALVLFLVSTMSVTLVERQTATIATLRSRGATRRHVFGTFVTQGMILGLLALLIGPFVAILLVEMLIHVLLPAAPSSSLNVLTDNLLQAALSVRWFALAAVICAVLALVISVRRATRMDVLAFRRESARSTRRPFWRRLNLDIIGAVLLALGFVGNYYLSQPALAQRIGPGLLAIQGLIALIAPFLASLIFFTLFLRLYPLCLRLGSRLAARRRKAPAVLAFAQMERAPRPASRMILLLALVISTTMFILTYTATQQQRTIDATNFAVGADFSEPIVANTHHPSLAQQTATYRVRPGVTSVTAGYTAQIRSNQTNAQTDVTAVDADTYASTALWTAQYSDQALSSLMASLVEHRSDAINHDTVYTLVDDTMAKQQGISPGSSFILPTADGYNIHFVVLGQIHAIPGIYDGSYRVSESGMLCDYTSYATVYAKNSGNTLDPNMVWLKTHDDANSLNSVRHAFPSLQDRRALIDTAEVNPLYVNVTGVLYLGIATALLLALLGTLFFSWLNAAGRLTNFAVLRALGMAPRQIAAVLFWEQGGIYMAALMLGLALGGFLLIFVKQALVFTDIITAESTNTTSFYTLPVQLIAPIGLIVGLLGALVVICGMALALMARLVARPSLGQILRLNED